MSKCALHLGQKKQKKKICQNYTIKKAREHIFFQTFGDVSMDPESYLNSSGDYFSTHTSFKN